MNFASHPERFDNLSDGHQLGCDAHRLYEAFFAVD
jgi:hypothetical protein